MGSMSRTKGKVAEREVGHILTAAGLEVVREQDGRLQTGDIRCEGLLIEVRNRQKLSLTAWSAAHELGCPPHLTPVVAYRSNRQPWRVSLLLSDFTDLIAEARS